MIKIAKLKSADKNFANPLPGINRTTQKLKYLTLDLKCTVMAF